MNTIFISGGRTGLIKRLVAFGLFATLLSLTGFGQQRPEQQQQQKIKQVPKELTPKEIKEMEKRALRAPSGASFYIAPIEGGKGQFSVLLTDAGGQSVSGTFSLKQIEIFEAVLEASMAFAQSDEKVGSGKPIVTRLMEQHEWSLFVDVSKIGQESKLYVSLVTQTGQLTTEAGQVDRSSKKPPSGLLPKILSQVQEAKNKPSQ